MGIVYRYRARSSRLDERRLTATADEQRDDLDQYSSYNYPEWKGSFYPSDLPAARCCHAAEGFPRSGSAPPFYRMPGEARQRLGGANAGALNDAESIAQITHDNRLKNVGSFVASFYQVACSARKLGAILFQLPPNLKKDLAVFDAFSTRSCRAGIAARSIPSPFVVRRGVLAPGGEESVAVRYDGGKLSRRCASPPTTRTSGCATVRPTRSGGGATTSRAPLIVPRGLHLFKHEEEEGPRVRALADAASTGLT